jgi:drug/metabolite transporter (DMT)-like permease
MYGKDKAVGRLTVALAAILFGCESVGVQLCYLGGFDTITLYATRFAIALLFFAATVLIFKVPFFVEKEYRLRVVIIGLGYVGTTWFLFSALGRLPAALAILFFYVYPSLTALIARIFWHQKLGAIKICALLLSAAGLVMLYWSSAAGIELLGLLFALLGALCNAIKLNIAGEVLPKVNIFTYSFDVFAVMFLSIFIIVPLGGGINLDVEPMSWIYLLFLTVGVTFGAGLLINRGLKSVPAVDVSILCLLEPPVTALTAYLFFHYLLTPWQLAGGILLLIAVVLPQLQEYRLAKNELPVANDKGAA